MNYQSRLIIFIKRIAFPVRRKALFVGALTAVSMTCLRLAEIRGDSFWQELWVPVTSDTINVMFIICAEVKLKCEAPPIH